MARSDLRIHSRMGLELTEIFGNNGVMCPCIRKNPLVRTVNIVDRGGGATAVLSTATIKTLVL